MTTLRVFLLRVLDLVLRRRRDGRLDEEIAAHLDLLTDQYLAQGLSRADARLAARRAFGAVEAIKADYRDQRGLPLVDALVQDARFAVRLMRRERGFALTAVLVLGLGIGVNNMLFTILNAHTIRGLPMYRADRVMFISNFDDRVPDRPMSYADFDDLRRSAGSFSGMAAFANGPAILAGDGRPPERLVGSFLTPGAFGLVGAQPVLGRDFTADDERPGAAAVVILGSGTWESRYGADRSIIGRQVTVNGRPATIIGVMPRRSGVPSASDVWLPIWQLADLDRQKRDARVLWVFGRLADGVDPAAARAEVESFTAGLAVQHPDTNTKNRASVVPVNQRFLGRLTDPVWLAFMTIGFIIVLISCANVANLMLARTAQRAREIAIRSALGAGRRRVIRQLLMEGAVIAALSGFVGFWLAFGGVRAFRAAIPADALPYWYDYSADLRVIAALIAVSALTVFVFALLPALQTSKTDVTVVLKEGGQQAGRWAGRRWASVVLAMEFALAVVLLSHFAVNVRSAEPDLPSDIALNTRSVLTATITLPADGYRTPAERTAFYGRLTRSLNGIPAISSFSTASRLPGAGAEQRSLTVSGAQSSDPASRPTVGTLAVGPRYFATLGLPLQAGREFEDGDGGPGRERVIVNEKFAQRFFAGTNPLGQRIALAEPGAPGATAQWLTVVGVAQAIRPGDSDPLVYLPHLAAPGVTSALLVRSGSETTALTSAVRAALESIDPALPLYRVRTMARVMRDAEWNGRISNQLFVSLTFIAVMLCAVGLYAVTAHGVSQGAREIGLRMALGARPHQVAGPIVRGVLAQLAAGFVAGVVCTALWDKAFGAGHPSIKATDPASLAYVAVALVLIAVAASILPARRATRLDPLTALGGQSRM